MQTKSDWFEITLIGISFMAINYIMLSYIFALPLGK